MTKTNATKDLHVAFIGAGAMAEAIVSGVLSHRLLKPGQLTASDRDPDRLAVVRDKFKIHTTTENLTAARKGQVVVLAVKPQALPKVLEDLHGQIRRNALVLSIVAGATIESIAAGLGHRMIVRTMPNTPAQVGEGMTVWAATADVSDSQRELVRAIVGALGQQLYVEDERFLDMATAISGSGPAYVFLLMEALIDAAVHLGFSRADARQLVVQTIRGTAIFAEQSAAHPAEMRSMVTSPGGTTAAALYQLEKGSLRTVLSKAVSACYQHSLVLGERMASAGRPSPGASASRSSPTSKSSRKTSRTTNASKTSVVRKRLKSH